jgi:hypothetical protein
MGAASNPMSDGSLNWIANFIWGIANDVLRGADLLGHPPVRPASQRFLPAAQVKCLHFHGTEVRKPIPSYQLFDGTLFEQVDEAVDFVLAKLARSVGVREPGAQAPVSHEIPESAVAETIVNAVAYRDYASPAGVQVHVLSDRVEVWNPGALPPSLTPEGLRLPHASYPRNPRIANVLFRAKYIEQAGTGTLDMIARCREARLPEPDFEQRGGEFVVTMWRDWLSDGALVTLGLSERQRGAVKHLRTAGRLRNADYQGRFNVSKATALEDLVARGVLRKVGTRGKGTHYVLEPNGLTKGSKGPSQRPSESGRAGGPGGSARSSGGEKGLTRGSSGSSRGAVNGATKGPKGPSGPAAGRIGSRGRVPETRRKPAESDIRRPSRRPAPGEDASAKRRGTRPPGTPRRGPRN